MIDNIDQDEKDDAELFGLELVELAEKQGAAEEIEEEEGKIKVPARCNNCDSIKSGKVCIMNKKGRQLAIDQGRTTDRNFIDSRWFCGLHNVDGKLTFDLTPLKQEETIELGEFLNA